MAKRTTILTIREGKIRLLCFRINDRFETDPYRVCVVLSPAGSPFRYRQISKHTDFLSVMTFLHDFYYDGVDALTVSEMVQWAKEQSV